jgi:hypothetical protein
MSLFEEASLVITPNAFKAGKLYAVKGADLSVTRATTATRVNSAGLIESVATNVPRLDYTNGTCPSILVEPQRTNLLTYSQQFDNAAWVKFNGATVTPNAVISPDGTANADQLIASPTQEIYNGGAKPLGSITYTVSCFAKYNGSVLKLQMSDFATSLTEAQFNLQTGAVGTISQGATWSNTTSSIQNYGNGWYRCILTSTSPVTATIYNSIIGNAYIYGSQLEAGSYATSYIPTTSASVTRNADVISKTGISSLIGQTEGTLFWEGIINGESNNNSGLFGVQKIASSSKIDFGLLPDNIYAQCYDGTNSLFFNTIPFVKGEFLKLAFAYKAGDYAIYKNGTLVANGTNATAIPTCDYIAIHNIWGIASTGSESCKSAIIFKTRLTNAELAELTTL